MLGTGLDITQTAQKAWWQTTSYLAADEAGGTIRPPGAIASFRSGRYAITTRDAASIGAASVDTLKSMQAVGFAGMFNFTRASNATYVDASGGLQLAGPDAPRLDYSNGKCQLLLEAPATNVVAASEMTGFVSGRRFFNDAGNIGVAPTGMMISFSGAPAGYVDLVSVTTDSKGRKGLRLEINIVNSSGSVIFPRVRFVEVAAAAADVWSTSAFIDIASTSHAISMQLEAQSPVSVLLVTSLAVGENNVAMHGGIFPSGSQTALRSQLGISLPAGQTWTAVMDVACPQLEKSPRCTSYIPTSGTAATRAADNCQFGAKALALIARPTAGLALRGELAHGALGNLVGGSNSRIVGLNSTQTQILLGSTTVLQLSSNVTVPLPSFGVAAGWDGVGRAGAYNGSAAASLASPHDANFTAASIGRGANFAPGWYDELVLYPFRPSAAALTAKAVAHA